MPRPRNPIKEASRARTESWRLRRQITGRPEASIVDRAAAASLAAFLSEALYADPKVPQPTLRDIVNGAQKILVDNGFDRRLSNAELMRRLTRRSDLPQLVEVTGASIKALTDDPSPPVTPVS